MLIEEFVFIFFENEKVFIQIFWFSKIDTCEWLIMVGFMVKEKVLSILGIFCFKFVLIVIELVFTRLVSGIMVNRLVSIVEYIEFLIMLILSKVWVSIRIIFPKNYHFLIILIT